MNIRLVKREIKPKFEMTFVEKTLKDKLVKTINLRELHTKLGNGDKFADWIKSRIEKYDFVENQDFVLISGNSEIKNSGRGGDRRSVEYFGTLTMAKELAMVENNVMGKIARRYFISCEEELLKQKPRVVIQESLFSLEDLGLGLLQVGIEQRQAAKRVRGHWTNIVQNSIGCGNFWLRRLTNEIYKVLLNCPQATASNFRQHMNLPAISAEFLTRDQFEGHIQSYVTDIEYSSIRFYSFNQKATFKEFRDFVLIQAKIYRQQLVRIAQGCPSDLIFNHEYNVIPILPYRERRMATKV